MVEKRTEQEIANGFRQFDLCLEIIQYYLHPERAFALRPSIVLELHKLAVQDIETLAGQFRQGSVGISKSAHVPPEAYLVEMHVRDFCEYINNNWHERNAFYLSAYAMWRLNWIHPFTDGNGRTARAVSYVILCIKLGYVLPGSPTIAQQIEEDKSDYIRALERSDESERNGAVDLTEMETMIKNMLASQLLGIIVQAGGEEAPPWPNTP